MADQRISVDASAGALDGTEIVPLIRVGSPVTAGSLGIGTAYVILSIGTTDFTAIGAASNTVGVGFVATGVGSGTGTAGATSNVRTTAQTIVDLGGGGGGEGFSDTGTSPYSFTATTYTLITDAEVTVGPYSSAKTAFVSASLSFTVAGNGLDDTLRGVIGLDGNTTIYPATGSFMGVWNSGDTNFALAIPMVPVAIPGDSATHTLGLYCNVEHSTNTRTLNDRSLVAIVF